MIPDIDTLIPPDVNRVALVGVAKNSGKTTTLQTMLDAVDRSTRTVGLVSVGLDGETSDLLLGTDKPSIRPRPGDWVVTAQNALNESNVRIDYVDSLAYTTPLGEVVVGEVLSDGDVILAGLRHRADLRRAVESLEQHGVDLVLIDGAYGRVSAACPDVSDGVIVSTGAIVGRDVEAIVDATAPLVERLRLPVVDTGWQRDLLIESKRRDRALLGGPDIEPVELDAKSALVALRDASDSWTDGVEAIAVPGVVTDSVLESLLAAPTMARLLLVVDATSMQTSPRLERRFRREWSIQVGSSVRLLGISYNPTSVRGDGVDPEALRAALADHWGRDVPVFNPIGD